STVAVGKDGKGLRIRDQANFSGSTKSGIRLQLIEQIHGHHPFDESDARFHAIFEALYSGCLTADDTGGIAVQEAHQRHGRLVGKRDDFVECLGCHRSALFPQLSLVVKYIAKTKSTKMKTMQLLAANQSTIDIGAGKNVPRTQSIIGTIRKQTGAPIMTPFHSQLLTNSPSLLLSISRLR